MKICPNCGSSVNDEANHCPCCGYAVSQVNPTNTNNGYNPYSTPYATAVKPTDHTAEFSQEEMHKYKLYAVLCYLFGFIGIVISKICNPEHSDYLDFHIRQALKFSVITCLAGILTILLSFTFIVPAVCGVFIIVVSVCDLISIFKTLGGSSIEMPVVRSFGFLN